MTDEEAVRAAWPDAALNNDGDWLIVWSEAAIRRLTHSREDWRDRALAAEARASAVPEELHAITDVVLKYRPKPKSKAAKKRKRKEKRETELRRG